MDTATWNRLTKGDPVHTDEGKMGGRIWDGTAEYLQKHSHRAFAPTLTTRTEHIEDICRLITGNKLQNVILAGQSYGGMIITGVASKIHRRIGHLVYADAALPDPGESLYDLIRSAGIDPDSFSGLEPAPPTWRN